MKIVPWVCLAGAFVLRFDAHARPPSPWILPHDREVYLMENDLVYARFLTLSRGGAYRQINRDEHGGTEVDRGSWEQDKTGIVRLHSTGRALRPRALVSGPLSILLDGARAFEGLPAWLTTARHFLTDNRDGVFGVETVRELNGAGTPAVHMENGTLTFDRRDLITLIARAEAALTGEQRATYLLEPLRNASPALFALQPEVFAEAELPGVRRTYRVADGAPPPFYFARVEAKTFAAAVGRWQPLQLPGGGP